MGLASMKKTRPRLPGMAITGLMAGSFVLSFLKVGREGFGDRYYAAAVKSMLSSWHNFFFASFDPGGFVTVDKPAPGLWIQTVSAGIFGFKGWALILPQALAGAVSVGLLYVIVKRAYGAAAGLSAALFLALTPISVAVGRTNQLDSLLLTVLLLAALAVVVATERSDLRWLLASMALLGVGFNIKMFAAYTVLPAFLLLYFLGSGLRLRKRIVHLAAAVIVLAAVSLSWALAVDLTPKDRRPYVGGSRTNSVLELAVDYNGINRLIPQWLRRGRFGFFRGRRGLPAGGARANLTSVSTPPPGGPAPNTAPAQAPPGMRAGGPFGFETGRAGVLRLFNRQMAGQASWLIVFSLIGTAVAAGGMKRPLFRDRKSRAVLLWAAWFFTLAIYFSTAGFFHRYYLNLVAPAIAALCAISVVELWQRYGQRGIGGWILPLAIFGAAGTQVVILAPFRDLSRKLAPIIIAAAGLAVIILAVLRIIGSEKRYPAVAAAIVGMAGLVVAPAFWSISASENGVAASMPAAGPVLTRGPGVWRGAAAAGPAFGGFNDVLETKKLVAFLEDNRRGEKFLLAVPNARLAWDIILETGEPVMAMGGFMGADQILTLAGLESRVRKGEVRYFLMRRISDFAPRFAARPAGAGAGGMFSGMGALGEITRWIEARGKPVPDEVWKDEADAVRERAPLMLALFFPNLPSIPLRPMMRGSLTLYELGPSDAR
jgi:4-amino-4-deoxy-L-arabinose transferase-like glycosyltransferase